MSLRIHLDGPSATYTNLDIVTGRVILNLPAQASFSSIIVKLEGESRTRLQGIRPGAYSDGQQGKPTTETEFHRLLYMTQTVFPTPELQRQIRSGSSYTLPPGQYEYPFQFKIPFNNVCWDTTNALSNVSIGGMRLEIARDVNRHVKRTLPPTLGGFPGLAEIKYFVKVTAARPKFFQENLRAFHDFRLMPIEPPRPGNSNQEEVYARRSNKFAQAPPTTPKKIAFRRASSNANQDSIFEPPAFNIDARLPNPTILTCNRSIPLRILVRKTNQSSEILFLSTLSIELLAFTDVRAHELKRREGGSWILTSQANMQIPLGSTNDPINKEHRIPSHCFDQVRLPSSVCPSFDTCNISRSYELEVRVGLSHGMPGKINPELIVLPLRFSVQIYSGIEPPRALLEAMAGGTSSSHQPSLVAPTAPYQAEPSPASPPYQGPNSHHAAPNTPQPPFDDAPPTYEEALSQDIGPIVGPRTNYNPPPSPTPPPMPQRPGTSRNGNSANALAGPSNSGRQPSVSQDSGVERQAGGPGGSSNGKEKMKF